MSAVSRILRGIQLFGLLATLQIALSPLRRAVLAMGAGALAGRPA